MSQIDSSHLFCKSLSGTGRLGFHADVPKAGSGTSPVPGAASGARGRLVRAPRGRRVRGVSPERSRPALQALPGQRRGRDGAAAARSWWVRPVRSPGGAPVPSSGVSVSPRPSEAPAGRGGPGAGSPQAQALPRGWGPGKGETPLRGRERPARLGSLCVGFCASPGSCLCGAGPGVPPVPASAGPGALRVPALPPRGFTGPARP